MFFQNRPYGVQTVIITFQNRLQDTFRDSVCVDCQGGRHAGIINSGDFFVFQSRESFLLCHFMQADQI